MGDSNPFSSWRSWTAPGFLAHPNSPAGGTGPGQARTPGPYFGTIRRSVPHPSSPAARHTDASYLARLEQLLPLDKLNSLLAGLTVWESSWSFVTSGGAELTIGTSTVHVGINGTAGSLWLRDETSGVTEKLSYGGLGGSFGLTMVTIPVNASFSIPDMPSSGTVYKLPFAGGKLTVDELKGAFLLITAAGDFGAGWGNSVMFLGGSQTIVAAAAMVGAGILQLPALVASSKACVRFEGMSATVVPGNVGVAGYVGYIQ